VIIQTGVPVIITEVIPGQDVPVTVVVTSRRLWSLPPRSRLKRPSATHQPGHLSDIVDPQKSSFVNEIAHLNLIYEG